MSSKEDQSPVLLDNGDSVLQVSLSKKVAYSTATVSPDDLLSVDEGVKLITQGTEQTKYYTIQQGDVLGSIASKFQLSMATLKQLNPGISDSSVLAVGDQIKVTAPQPLVDVVEQKAVTRTRKIPYHTEIKKDNTLYAGESKVLQKGSPGKEKDQYLVTVQNGIVSDEKLNKKTILIKPTDKILEKGTKVIPSRGTGHFGWPAEGGVITSRMGMRWGKFHKGIDIAGVSNPAILAADNGIVIYAQWDNGGYGNRVIINHHNGYKTTYNHMSKLLVHVGQVVRKGEQLGVMGETGDATGVHLHFEMYKNGHLVNPLDYVTR